MKSLHALDFITEEFATDPEALVAVKSPSEFLELQTVFLRKQIEKSAQQSKALQALMLRASEDMSKPIKDAFEKTSKVRKAV
ncbi:phasin family protein [Mesorhizobium sp. M0293]|uniref:phasin family protein n=1 Tax=Mesorhizobium sp. M0293 TaxID=2956930 RepID=UPI00333DE6F8